MNCNNCGRAIDGKEVIISVQNGKSIDIFCPNCSRLFGTCHMCTNNTSCGFFNDPDPMPQMIVIQQKHQTPMGYTVIQKQVPNPDRIRKFCLDTNCVCVDNSDPEHPLCCRNGGCTTCTNYREKEQFKFGQNFSMIETPEN